MTLNPDAWIVIGFLALVFAVLIVKISKDRGRQ